MLGTILAGLLAVSITVGAIAATAGVVVTAEKDADAGAPFLNVGLCALGAAVLLLGCLVLVG